MGSKSSKTDKDKETTKQTKGKLKTSKSSKLLSNTTNLFKKNSLRNDKSISCETVPSKENEKKCTKTDNFPIKTSDVNGAKQFHLDDSFIEQIFNLNINDGSTYLNKSALQKYDNKISFEKKDFDNSLNTLYFDKNIKIEESDIAPNNFRTALRNTEVKIENNENLVNTSHNSTSNSEDNQNKPEGRVLERAPEKTVPSIRRNRLVISPLRTQIFEADEAIENNINNLRLKEYISEEIEKAIKTEISKSSYHGVENNVWLTENIQEIKQFQCNNNFESLYIADNSYHFNFPNTEFIEANEVLEKRKRVAPTPESLPSPGSCSSSEFQLNDLSGSNESVDNFLYRIQTYIKNNCLQSDNLLPNAMHYSKLNQTAHEKSIASKNQQTCYYELMTKARHRLFNSRTFDKEKCLKEYLHMYSRIRAGEFGTTDKEVIHNLKLTGAKKYRRTNLHAAVKEENLEKIFCIVEMHKQYHTDISTLINMRDNKGKTVLDRAEENKKSGTNDLLIDYLKENYAEHSIHHMIPLSPTGTKSC